MQVVLFSKITAVMGIHITTKIPQKYKWQIWTVGALHNLRYLLESIRVQTYVLYSVFFMASFILIVSMNKFSLHKLMNSYHHPFFDWFFKYSTHLGDGAVFGVLVLVFLFINRKMALVFLTSGVLTLLITHLLKKVIFYGIARPLGAMSGEELHLVQGVKMAFWHSFPSGHTTTAFAVFTILCLYFRKCKSQYVWLALAMIAGLSRVYLSQHFLLDVFVGSFIGCCIAFMSMSFFFNPKPTASVH